MVERITIADVKGLPPTVSPSLASSITGRSTHQITNMLARGEIKGAKVGCRWYINTAALLRQFGIVTE